MADKEANATAGKEKRKERWLFTDEMVEELLEVLRDRSRDEYREFKKKVNEHGRAMKLGYDRIKAKVKKLRSGFQNVLQSPQGMEVDELSRNTGIP